MCALFYTETVTCYNDRPVLSTGRTAHDKQNRIRLDYNQNLVMSPRGAGSQDGLTD